jgi:hypothetical protein
MISIGLAGWGDHDLIYSKEIKPQQKLKEYNKYFSIVEVDSWQSNQPSIYILKVVFDILNPKGGITNGNNVIYRVD